MRAESKRFCRRALCCGGQITIKELDSAEIARGKKSTAIDAR